MSTTGHCHYCGRRLEIAERTRDHIVPRSIGGRDNNSNIVPACGPCNAAKGNEWPRCTCAKCARARRLFRQMKRRLA